jgi:subtilase family serine protease
VNCGPDITCYVLTLDATVYNTGTSSVTQVKVKFETALGEKTETISSIAGGSHKHVSVSFQQVFTKPSSGAWSIEVDPTNKIDECDETNNEDSGRCNW